MIHFEDGVFSIIVPRSLNYNFQNRRPIMTLGGVYTIKQFSLTSVYFRETGANHLKTVLKKAIKLRLNGLIVKKPTVGGQRGRQVIIQGADNVPSCHSISCNTSWCSDNANPGQQAMTKKCFES